MFRRITHRPCTYSIKTRVWISTSASSAWKFGPRLISDSCDGHSRVPSDSQREVLLELPGAPTLDEQDASQVRNLLTKRALGPGLIPGTDDRRKTYEELAGQGVEMTQEPVEQPYGIDCAIRDPFGNHIRIPQLAAEMAETTDEVKNRWAGETA